MDAELTIKNYRCFADSNPATLRLPNDFTITALVGANNSGKSSLLKFFYEMRGLFSLVANNDNNFRSSLKDKMSSYPQAASISDLSEISVRLPSTYYLKLTRNSYVLS